MQQEQPEPDGYVPDSLNQLRAWVHGHPDLPAAFRAPLVAAIDAVFARHERLCEESKRAAIHELSASFADKIAGVNAELAAKDATVSSISQYFERLVSTLTNEAQRDPKTHLMNFTHFTDRLRSFLSF